MSATQSSALAVKFYRRPVDMEFESQIQGRPIVKMMDYVKIEIPGNMLSVIDTIANQDHKDRFPIEWQRFCNEQTEGGQPEYVGTALTDWTLLNAAQAAELKHYKFYTVEQIAEASDHHISQVGMLAGMAPHAMRDKARAFLALAKQSAETMHRVDEMAQIRQEKADLEERLRRTEEMVAQMLAAQGEKAKPGRPRKEATEA